MVKCGVLFEVRTKYYLDDLQLQGVNEKPRSADQILANNEKKQSQDLHAERWHDQGSKPEPLDYDVSTLTPTIRCSI
jgi:hypothetical protein